MSRRRSRSTKLPSSLDISTVILLLALALLPAYFNIQSSTSFEPDKGALLRSLALLALAPLLLSWLNQRRTGAGKAGTPISLPFALLAAFGGVSALATLLSVDPVTSLWGNHERGYGLLTVLSGLVMLVVAYRASRAGRMWLIIDAILLSVAIPALYGVVQVLGYDPVRGQTVSFELGQRASSSLGNPLFLADFLLTALLLTSARLLAGPALRKTPRAFLLGYCIFLAAALAATLSRSALIAALVAGVFLLSSWGRREGRGLVRWAGFGLLGAGALLLITAWAAPQLLPSRLGDIFASGGTGGQRLLIWQGVFDAFKAHPARLLLGMGYDTLPLTLAPHIPPTLAHFEVDWFFRIPDRAHTMPLELLSQTGLVGLSLWMLFNAALLEKLLPPWPGKLSHAPLLFSLVGAVAGVAGAGILAGVTATPLGLSAGFLGGALLALLLAPSSPDASTPFTAMRPFLLATVAGHWAFLTFSFPTHTAELLVFVVAGIILGLSEQPSPFPHAPHKQPPPTNVWLRLMLAGVALATFAFSLSAAGMGALPLWMAALFLLYYCGYFLSPQPAQAARHWYWFFIPVLAILPALFLNRRAGLSAWLAYAWILLWLLVQIYLLLAARQRRKYIWASALSLLVLLAFNLPTFGDIAYKSAVLTPQDGQTRNAYMSRALLLSPYDDVLAAGIVPTENLHLPADATLEHPQARRIMALYERAMRSQPLAVEPVAAYADWLRQRALADAAAVEPAFRMFERSLALAPNDLMTRNRLALLYAATGDAPKAISTLKALLDIDPLYGPTYLNLASLYQAQGDIAAAKNVLETGRARVSWWEALPQALAELEANSAGP